MTEKQIWTLADNLWHGAGWQYPLKNASATYQDQYRRIARFLSESGCLEEIERYGYQLYNEKQMQARDAAVDKLTGGER